MIVTITIICIQNGIKILKLTLFDMGKETVLAASSKQYISV